MAKADEHALAKLAHPESNALAYPFHDRANDLYGMWMTGYTEDEISLFMGISVDEVKKDLMYVNTRLSTNQIIKHNNDRTRILLQRNESEAFREMMKDSLSQSVEKMINVGLSPASILKEFREATGMVQKAEPLLQINTQVNTTRSVGGGVTSAEDIIRRVLNEINQETLDPVDSSELHLVDPPVIDAEVVDSEEYHIPDPDEP
jgi:DNA-binding CsgD family transcriptional regulator